MRKTLVWCGDERAQALDIAWLDDRYRSIEWDGKTQKGECWSVGTYCSYMYSIANPTPTPPLFYCFLFRITMSHPFSSFSEQGSRSSSRDCRISSKNASAIIGLDKTKSRKEKRRADGRNKRKTEIDGEKSQRKDETQSTEEIDKVREKTHALLWVVRWSIG